jgi:hypothetical protein
MSSTDCVQHLSQHCTPEIRTTIPVAWQTQDLVKGPARGCESSRYQRGTTLIVWRCSQCSTIPVSLCHVRRSEVAETSAAKAVEMEQVQFVRVRYVKRQTVGPACAAGLRIRALMHDEPNTEIGALVIDTPAEAMTLCWRRYGGFGCIYRRCYTVIRPWSTANPAVVNNEVKFCQHRSNGWGPLPATTCQVLRTSYRGN